MNPLFPDRRLWSAGSHAVWVFVATVLSVISVGIFPLIHRSGVRERKRRYTGLFCQGAFTPGAIDSVEKRPPWAIFKYEFEVAGLTHVAFMEYAQEMMQYWGEGDSVPVLYDPEDPTRSCFIYG